MERARAPNLSFFSLYVCVFGGAEVETSSSVVKQDKLRWPQDGVTSSWYLDERWELRTTYELNYTPSKGREDNVAFYRAVRELASSLINFRVISTNANSDASNLHRRGVSRTGNRIYNCCLSPCPLVTAGHHFRYACMNPYLSREMGGRGNFEIDLMKTTQMIN